MEDMYDQEIIDEFIVEATELLVSAEEDIIDLEEKGDKEFVNRIFRAFHTVKGNAAMLGMDSVSSLAHASEEILTRIRGGEIEPDKALVDLLLKSVDALKHMLAQTKDGQTPDYDVSALTEQLLNIDETSGETPAEELPGKKDLNILVVEDDITSQEILRELLSNYGTVEVAENGEKAIKAVEVTFQGNDTPAYDVICMDIRMPGIDGMEAARKIREIERDQGVKLRDEAAIIMTTALDDPKTVIRSLYKSGATAYLVKPVKRELLERDLKKLDLI